LFGVQSGAVDHQPGIVRLALRRYMGHTLVDVDALYLFAQEKASARLLEYFGVLLRHHTEVDNTRLRHQYATDARCMGLVFPDLDRKSTRLNSSHVKISYAVFCLKKKKYF